MVGVPGTPSLEGVGALGPSLGDRGIVWGFGGE